MKRLIYLSGPMSRVERADYVRRFGEAERILHRHGYGVINPCNVWACRFPWIYKAMEFCLGHSKAYALILAYDLILLMTDGKNLLNHIKKHFPTSIKKRLYYSRKDEYILIYFYGRDLWYSDFWFIFKRKDKKK